MIKINYHTSVNKRIKGANYVYHIVRWDDVAKLVTPFTMNLNRYESVINKKRENLTIQNAVLKEKIQ